MLMVPGTVGREGSITITNGGPGEESGTVTVTGTYGDNESVVQYPLLETPTYQSKGEDVYAVSLHSLDSVTPDENNSAYLNAEPFEFLPPGSSQTWTFSFSVDTATTVQWVATVAADPANDDVNLTNNMVTEETKVTASKGRGK